VTDSYNLSLKRSAEKELRALPPKDLKRVMERLQALAIQPRPHGCEKMVGEERYRIRQGDWRVVYSVDDTLKAVTIFKIGHRREVYRTS
jgi:mRNA interferase RelE/StbE